MQPPQTPLLFPDYLFEISWEVCNKVGGIYTVISTKASFLQQKLGDHYIFIGPDLLKRDGQNTGFIEDKNLFKVWSEKAATEGLKIKTGRWDIAGSPLVILIDFTTFYDKKNEIFGALWEKYRLDSITGKWDYIDPALFGYAAGNVIASYYQLHLNATDKIVAQFHEWMTGAGILYLEKNIPQIATIFTTHATVLGRTLSGSGIPMYASINQIIPDEQAATYQVTAKHSLEKTAANTADCFCCVSDITASECTYFLGKTPDIITPNGFQVLPIAENQKTISRHKLLSVAADILKETLPDNTLLIIKSGRYEFHNKGIDLFINAIGTLKKQPLPLKIIAFLFIPAAHVPLNEQTKDTTLKVATHHPYAPERDDICQLLRQNNLNIPDHSNISIIYAPVYLDGNDGVFNMHYYDLLQGFDLAIFPSFYEPWGYTPLESLAYGIPTVTTDLSGFGQSVNQLNPGERKGLFILPRKHISDDVATDQLAGYISQFAGTPLPLRVELSKSALQLSKYYQWPALLEHYFQAYHLALEESQQREDLFRNKPRTLPADVSSFQESVPAWREIHISNTPAPALNTCRLSGYDNCDDDLTVAYFCMEYGIESSFRIYSGGLGILAGDYLKTASDMNVRLMAIGLFYREGFFRQQLSDTGIQSAINDQQDPAKHPLEEVKNSDNQPLQLLITFPGRPIHVKAWKIQINKTSLFLLDTDVITNNEQDRLITSRLYPSDKEQRLQQEIILGIGGVLLIRALGLPIDVYHCNEGHAAFIALERISNVIKDNHLSFEEAFEIVKASQLFTTHTSMAASIDTYSEPLLHKYFSGLQENYFISWQQFMKLGKTNPSNDNEEFSMFTLAARTAQEINAVSRIHQYVTAGLLHAVWKDIQPDELPLTYITNGIHIPTWAAEQWQHLLQECGIDIKTGNGPWGKILTIQDDRIWALRLNAKKQFVQSLRSLLDKQQSRHHQSQEKTNAITELLQPDTLCIGFARRITGYKRSDILFQNMDRLRQIISNTRQPVVIIFSGKAHPADTDGLRMLQHIYTNTSDPHIIFLEDYDMDIARMLVQGVDLWLNFPVRGKEASGTSGMKALINGVLNFSTRDGWWAEQYAGDCGWALKEDATNQEIQDSLDAEEIYNMLQHEIIPLYYKRNENGIPVNWVAMIKNSMTRSGQAISMTTMLSKYNYIYKKLKDHTIVLRMNNYQLVKHLAEWKDKIRNGWDSIKIVKVIPDKQQVLSGKAGEQLHTSITIDTGILKSDDIGAEILFTLKHPDTDMLFRKTLQLCHQQNNESTFNAEVLLQYSGEYKFAFRIYARYHSMIYKTDMPYVKWA
ncbi:alpha-glucan family phosphorylase [[Flexibacter] sp. ATCC 35208]|uniref:alpha-glucan family phosphorylase n=1 Tax=[Flexibacter] sp. ATCC 35208 TaxID=1936242 RepID=UPI0009D09F24|nr:alpha-glucan family phosphorylase [[Flexibacter] sp. ATCC 35208]OMP76177.1 hypothetical protein BW716_26215 [[Flexibacter] sp. ATCC 35208]